MKPGPVVDDREEHHTYAPARLSKFMEVRLPLGPAGVIFHDCAGVVGCVDTDSDGLRMGLQVSKEGRA